MRALRPPARPAKSAPPQRQAPRGTGCSTCGKIRRGLAAAGRAALSLITGQQRL